MEITPGLKQQKLRSSSACLGVRFALGLLWRPWESSPTDKPWICNPKPVQKEQLSLTWHYGRAFWLLTHVTQSIWMPPTLKVKRDGGPSPDTDPSTFFSTASDLLFSEWGPSNLEQPLQKCSENNGLRQSILHDHLGKATKDHCSAM